MARLRGLDMFLRSFRGVLVLSVVLVHAVVTPALFVGILKYVESGYESQFIDKARAMSNLLATQISQYDIQNEQGAVIAFLDDLMLGGQLSYIDIVREDNERVSPAMGQISRATFSEDFYFGQHNDQVYFISVPVIFNTNLIKANIEFGFDEVPVQEQIDTALYRGAYIALAYLLVMVALMMFIAGKLARSLKSLRGAANKISAGETHNTLSINSRISEFSGLADDLERMRFTLVRQKKMVQRREAFVRAVMNNMAEAMMIIDHDLHIDSMNLAAEHTFGVDEDDMIGQPVEQFFTEECRDALQSHLSACLNNGGQQPANESTQEWVALRHNGQAFFVELGLSLIVLDENPLIICNLHDVTLRKNTEHALIQARRDAEDANQSKSLFLSTMSHELRTPLNAVIGYSEILMDDAQDRNDDAAINDLEKIRSSGRHLLALINNILDLSKIEAGKMELFISDFELKKLIDEAIDTTRPLIEANGNELKLNVGCDAISLRLDETKTRQVIINLLSNAAKFTSNGTIGLSVECESQGDNGWIQIAISDTGIGIPTDRLGRLFENFSQVDAEVTTKYGGTGLGLSISRKFCQLMGGDISVTSKDGEGSTFVMKLPLVAQEVPST